MQLTLASTASRAATARDLMRLFRFPFGDRDARTRGVANAKGYFSVLCTADTLGWQGKSGGQSPASVTHWVLANTHIRLTL